MPEGDSAAFVCVCGGVGWGGKPTYRPSLMRDPAPGEHAPAIYSSPQRSVSGARAGNRVGEVERAEAGGEGSRERQRQEIRSVRVKSQKNVLSAREIGARARGCTSSPLHTHALTPTPHR